MPAEILKQRLAALEVSKSDEAELRKMLEAMVDGIEAVCTLLDNDATLTATTCKQTFNTYLTK